MQLPTYEKGVSDRYQTDGPRGPPLRTNVPSQLCQQSQEPDPSNSMVRLSVQHVAYIPQYAAMERGSHGRRVPVFGYTLPCVLLIAKFPATLSRRMKTQYPTSVPIRRETTELAEVLPLSAAGEPNPWLCLTDKRFPVLTLRLSPRHRPGVRTVLSPAASVPTGPS